MRARKHPAPFCPRGGRERTGSLLVTLLFGSLLVVDGLVGCASEKGHPPVARLSIEPKYIPVNVETEITLDGRRSCDEVDHPEGCDKSGDGSGPTADCPQGVTFQWELDREVNIISGGPKEPMMKVRVTSDRPVSVVLKVKDCAGDVAEIHGEIGVILPWPDASTSPTVPDAGL